MTIANVTNMATPRLQLAELVAASATFQTVTGTANPTAAMAFVHSPYADDHLVAGVMVDPRPRCIINHQEYSRDKLGTAYGATSGTLQLVFEFDPVEPIDPDPNVRLSYFEEQIGNILDEMETDAGKDRDADEKVHLISDRTHLNATRFELVAGPMEAIQDEEDGYLFYSAIFLVDYVS